MQPSKYFQKEVPSWQPASICRHMNKPAFRGFEPSARKAPSWDLRPLGAEMSRPAVPCLNSWPAESVSIIHSCFYATTFCGDLPGSHSNWKVTKWVICYQAVDRLVPLSADGFKGPVFKSVGGWGGWGEGMTSRTVSQAPFSSLQTAASLVFLHFRGVPTSPIIQAWNLRMSLMFPLPSPSWGFPGVSHGKESACNGGDPGLIPGSGRSPGEGNGNPLQYSCLENPMDRKVWWGHKESDTAKQLTLHPPGVTNHTHGLFHSTSQICSFHS